MLRVLLHRIARRRPLPAPSDVEAPSPAARAFPYWGVAGLALLVVAAAAWRWTPLGQWLTVGELERGITALKTVPWAGLWVVGTFVVAGQIFLPITVLTVVTIATFGPVYGFAYAMAGTVLAAVITYGVGHALGRRGVRQLTERLPWKLPEAWLRHELYAVIFFRVVPMGPFTLVNLLAGASPVRLPAFVIGTVLGVLPGKVLIIVLVNQVQRTLREPGPASFLVLAAVVAALALAAVGLQRWLARRAPTPPGP